MGKIKILDNLTIQKIAAGEVIERPASIVKELVENSIDANANNIVVEISEGGKSFIRITDDGDGIDEEDMKIAFERHSTSKLRTIEDIYNIMSLGFRGEALSSISSVSKVEVLNEKTEGNYISDIVNKLALGNYNNGFKFIRDNKVVLQTNSNSSLKDNIYQVLGKEFSKNLVEVNFEKNGVKIYGYISNNNLYRSNRSHQYVYINGRYIVDYGISSVIDYQYKSLIPLNRFPVFILYIEMNPGDIDVNIHPTKQEIKFINNTNIHGIISNIVRDALQSSLYVPKMGFKEEKEDKNAELTELFSSSTEETNVYDDIVVKDYTADISESTEKTKPVNTEFQDYKFFQEEVETKNAYSEILFFKEEVVEELKIDDVLSHIKPIGMAFGTYIVAENPDSTALYFIDQHAAHERIMYERYLEEFRTEGVNTQQLIAPEVIELTNSEMDEVVSNFDLFLKLGFDIEEFGPNSIALRGVPLIFGEPNARNLFLEILDNIKQDFKSSYDIKVEKIMKLACSSAIKAGDRLSDLEIMTLFKDLQVCDNPYTCPHGRPIMIEISQKDIEKQFLRIG